MILGAVRHRAGVLIPAGHRAGEAMALGGAGHVDLVARDELVNLQHIIDLVTRAVIEAEFAQHALGFDASLLVVALNRLAEQLLSALLGQLAKTNLNGVVAIRFDSLGLHNRAGAGLDHSDRNKTAIFGEDLRHADLLTHDRFLHCFVLLPYSFISISTQASTWRPRSWRWRS